MLLCKEILLLTGNFNIHVNDLHDTDARMFLETLEVLGLEQHFDQPTHRDGHILDLTITPKSEEFYTQFVEENGSNQKKLFNAAKKLLGERSQLLFLEHANKAVLANDIGRFFVRTIERMRTDMDSVHHWVHH